MRQVISVSLKTLVAGAVLASLACGGGGGGDGQETADLIGTVSDPVVAGSVHSSSVTTAVDVVAVDEDGNVADSATNVTDQFTLTVPTGHDYVVIVSDGDGVIGAMIYGAEDRPDFTVSVGVATVHLGNLTIDRGTRSVVTDDSDGEIAEPIVPRIDASVDHDGDHIPDSVDNDDDNDGIDDIADVGDGHDQSLDHDNDGVDDSQDSDDDNDGITDVADDHPYDADNNGEDDDREHGAMGTSDGDAAAGAAVFVACGGCHGQDGSGGAAESIRGKSAGEIAEALMEGEDDMPSFPDLVDSAADIAAFLSGATDTTGGGTDTDSDAGTGSGGDAAAGATLFAANSCSTCHGATGAGSINIRNATETQVANALQSGPGSMPTFPDLVGSAADIAAFLSQ
jgi:mono/diheme cytochrome c family protein